MSCELFKTLSNSSSHGLQECKESAAILLITGFVWVLENLESPGILLWHFPGLESPGKGLLVLESSGNLLNSSKKYEMYGRQ